MRLGWARRRAHWPADAVRGSGRLHLRPLRRSDYRKYVSLERESEAWLGPWTPLPAPDRYSRRRFVRQVRWARDQARLGAYHRFGIFLNSGGRIAGSASVSSIQYGAAWGCSVGYWIGRPFAGQGIMPEALCLLLDYVFLDLSLHRIQLSIMPGNRLSRRVVEKLGLRRRCWPSSIRSASDRPT